MHVFCPFLIQYLPRWFTVALFPLNAVASALEELASLCAEKKVLNNLTGQAQAQAQAQQGSQEQALRGSHSL